MEEKIYCSHCGALIDDDDYEEINGQLVCSDCVCKKSSKTYNNSPESVQKKFATKCTSQRVIDFL